MKMRKRVSADIRAWRFFVIPAVVILAYFNIRAFADTDEAAGFTGFIFPVISLVVVIICCFIYRSLDRAETIEFDDMHLYVSGKQGAEVIPLESIVSLKMTSVHLNERYRWRIIYRDSNLHERSVTFFPRPLYENMIELANAIRSRNNDATIQKLFYGPFQVDKWSD